MYVYPIAIKEKQVSRSLVYEEITTLLLLIMSESSGMRSSVGDINATATYYNLEYNRLNYVELQFLQNLNIRNLV